MPDFPMMNRPAPAGPSTPIGAPTSPSTGGEDRKVQLANQLYEDATKMQKDAEELMRALGTNPKPSMEPTIPQRPMGMAPTPAQGSTRPMPSPVAQAANNALIGR